MSSNKELVNLILNKTLFNTRPVIITDTTARTGLNGHTIQCIEDTVIASISYNSDPNSNVITGITLPAGFMTYLPSITSITLTSGKLIVHQLEG